MATNNADNFSNPVAISQGGTNAISMTTTDGVVYFDGTKLVTTSAGTSGYILTSNGAGVAPAYKRGGPFVKIQSQVASNSAVLTFTTGITSTYNSYFFIVSNATSNITENQIYFRYSTNGGSSYVSTGYNSNIPTLAQTSTSFVNGGALNFTCFLTNSIGSANKGSGEYYLFNMTNGKSASVIGQSVVQHNSGATTNFSLIATNLNNGAAINAFEVLFGSGLIATGKFTLYGILES